jgi:hypothetical protein
MFLQQQRIAEGVTFYVVCVTSKKVGNLSFPELLVSSSILLMDEHPKLLSPLTLQRGDLNSAAMSLLRHFFQPAFKF